VYKASVDERGLRAVVTRNNNSAKILDAHSGKVLHSLEGHPNAVINGTFLAGSKRVLTWEGWLEGGPCASYGTRIWDTETGDAIAIIDGLPSAISDVRWSAKRGLLLTRDEHGIVRLWRLPQTTQETIDLVKEMVPRCLSIQERRHFSLPPEPPSWCRSMRLNAIKKSLANDRVTRTT